MAMTATLSTVVGAGGSFFATLTTVESLSAGFSQALGSNIVTATLSLLSSLSQSIHVFRGLMSIVVGIMWLVIIAVLATLLYGLSRRRKKREALAPHSR
jgi:phage-related minor tail protein